METGNELGSEQLIMRGSKSTPTDVGLMPRVKNNMSERAPPKLKTPEEEYFRLTVLALKMLHHEHRLASHESQMSAGWVNEVNTKTLD